MNKNIEFYHHNAITLNTQYQSVSFEQTHGCWKAFWPSGHHRQCKVLDIGAGNGLNAAWFAHQACDVYAVEPAEAFRQLGEQRTEQLSVTWINDLLPSLKTVEQLSLRFDCILLSAVWMHIPPTDRKRSFRKLANLLAPNGRLVISLRFGDFSDERTAYAVSIEELEQLAKDYGLQTRLITPLEKDELGRNEVQWQTLVFSLPDDGSGDLITVRHIIVNDSKSSTYKLALLRILLRIADSHPGAVIYKKQNRVYLPLGLIALYWIKLYKRLIDTNVGNEQGIQQNSASTKGLAFVKPEGWNKLNHLTPDDLAIGCFFLGEDAKAIQQALKDAISTIDAGPVKFIYRGDKTNTLFRLEKEKYKKVASFIIDQSFLSNFGVFSLESTLWDCLRLYASWIDPLLVNQWIQIMSSYELNQKRNISLQTYHDCLTWLNKEHDTKFVRLRVDKLRKNNQKVTSAWSDNIINDDYQIDHCLPFSYWPNNDKWNLLPTTRNENNTKSNRVPSKKRLAGSKSRIIDFWLMAWVSDEDQARFFTEASLSLPSISALDRDYEKVYEALRLQVAGVQSRLLVKEW